MLLDGLDLGGGPAGVCCDLQRQWVCELATQCLDSCLGLLGDCRQRDLEGGCGGLAEGGQGCIGLGGVQGERNRCRLGDLLPQLVQLGASRVSLEIDWQLG